MPEQRKSTDQICLIGPALWDELSSLLPKTRPLKQFRGAAPGLKKENTAVIILSTACLETCSMDSDEISRKLDLPYLGFLLLSDQPQNSCELFKPSGFPSLILPPSIPPRYLFMAIESLFAQLKQTKENLQLQKDLALNEKGFQSIFSLSKAIATEKNFEVVVTLILKQAIEVTYADSGSIYIVEENIDEAQTKFLRFKRSLLTLDTDEFLLPIDTNSIAGYVALTGEPLLIEDVHSLSRDLPYVFNAEFDHKHNYHTKSMLVLPMINQIGETMGVLQFINRKSRSNQKLSLENMRGDGVMSFNRRDYLWANIIASQSAIALYNQKLIEEQRGLLESFIELIDTAIDTKSSYTGGHCHRVPILVEMLAKAACESQKKRLIDFDLSEKEWYELRIATGLHDCGKIITPVHIMDKATKLETIYDRIGVVRLRFELLRSNAREEHSQRIASQQVKPKESQTILEQRLSEIDDMQNFIEEVNIGGESLGQEDIQRIHQISREYYSQNGSPQPVLTKNEIYNLSVIRGTLTKEERLIINSHMVETVKMLGALPFPPNLQRVPEYACGHHEKMDGSGYPRGIFAQDMSIPARIMAIADVFEALTAIDRPYKKEKKLSETMKIMGEMKRTNHFDPDIFDLFVESRVYHSYAEQYLLPELIDEVDEEALLKIQPKDFECPPLEERKERWKAFLPEYRR